MQDLGSLAKKVGSSALCKLMVTGWTAHVAFPAGCANNWIQTRGMPLWSQPVSKDGRAGRAQEAEKRLSPPGKSQMWRTGVVG